MKLNFIKNEINFFNFFFHSILIEFVLYKAVANLSMENQRIPLVGENIMIVS